MDDKTVRDNPMDRKLFDTISTLDTVRANHSSDMREDANSGPHDSPRYNSLKKRFERYINEKFLAAGGEKAVFSVYDSYSGRNVALARPIFHRFDNEKELFIKEALVCAKLQHPNIVPVYDVGVDCVDIPYFTMKLFDGDTFKHVLKNLQNEDPEYLQKYDLNKLLTIFLQICDAIEYAHVHNIIHCDIKPENIHIDKFGSVLVGDWGLSKVISTSHENYNKESSLIDLEVNVKGARPKPGSIRGTPGYLAPEILNGIHSGDLRSDIYSLGAMLYEMLSFKKPVSGGTPEEVFENTRKGMVNPLCIKSNSRRDPNALKHVVMKALSFDTQERYQSVGDLKQEVTNFLHGFATSAEKSSYLVLLRLMIHRHKLAAGLITGFTLLIVFILFTGYSHIITEKADAEIKRDIAEKNLYLFRQVNKKAKILSDSLSRLVRNSKFLTKDSIDYRIVALSYAINYESDETQKQLLYKEKAELHYVIQEFNNAVKCMENLSDAEIQGDDLFFKECQQLAKLKPDDKQLLSPDELSYLLSNPVDSTLSLKLFYLYTQRAKNTPPQQMKEAVRKTLNLINNVKDSPFRIGLSTEGGEIHLNMRHAPFTEFILPIETEKPFNILAVLEPSSIDLSYSWLNDLSKLKGLSLKEVNIANTNIHKDHLWGCIKRLNIESVIMLPGQFPEEDVKANEKFVKVSYLTP